MKTELKEVILFTQKEIEELNFYLYAPNSLLNGVDDFAKQLCICKMQMILRNLSFYDVVEIRKIK